MSVPVEVAAEFSVRCEKPDILVMTERVPVLVDYFARGRYLLVYTTAILVELLFSLESASQTRAHERKRCRSVRIFHSHSKITVGEDACVPSDSMR